MSENLVDTLALPVAKTVSLLKVANDSLSLSLSFLQKRCLTILSTRKCLILLRLLPNSPHICLPSSHFANNIWPKGTQRWRHTSYSEPGKYQKEYWHTGVKGWSSLNNKAMESCWPVKRPLSTSVYYMWLTLFVIQILWYHAVLKCISVWVCSYLTLSIIWLDCWISQSWRCLLE